MFVPSWRRRLTVQKVNITKKKLCNKLKMYVILITVPNLFSLFCVKAECLPSVREML